MGFLAPWFLAGLVAVGVPVFVHMLRHNVRPPRPVSSLMFFERGTRSSTRHRRLKHWVLLTLRFALILLVVLAFANPFIRRAEANPNGRLLLVALDRSFSMRAGTRFADAKQQAIRMVAQKSPGQKAQILVLGGQIEVLTQALTDAAQLRSALAGVQPGDGHADFGELARVVRSVASAERGPIDLHLFSDMQQTAMPTNFGDVVLPQNVKLILHPVAKAPAPPNWTVQSVQAPAEISDPKDSSRFRIRAVVAGLHTPAARKAVSLFVNGASIATRSVDVPAGGRAAAEFTPSNLGYGWNRCEVRIDSADAFPVDDESLFAIRRSDPERVLFVHGSADTRSPLYFGAALRSAAEAAFAMQSMAAEQTTDVDPSRYAFVVLSDAVALPSMFEHALMRYVQHGGGVMIALGTATARSGSIPLWTGRVQRVQQEDDPVTVGRVDFTYPALNQEQPVQGNGGWEGAKFFYSVVVDPAQARVAMRLSDGTPLLIDRQVGLGHLLLFASGFDNLTNDLPLHPIFVAFVDRTARYLSGIGELGGSRVVDSYVQLRPAGQGGNQGLPVEVVDPDGHRLLSLGEARILQSIRLTRAGFYRIRLATGRDVLVGTNPDRRESDLEPLGPEIQQLWSGASGHQQEQAGEQVPGGVTSRPTKLWRWVMLLALAVAAAETVLASRYMGTQRDEL
jgi:hypothetical protein